MRDGKATRMKMYGSVDDARASAGIGPVLAVVTEAL
jgi:hypothetical protein